MGYSSSNSTTSGNAGQTSTSITLAVLAGDLVVAQLTGITDAPSGTPPNTVSDDQLNTYTLLSNVTANRTIHKVFYATAASTGTLTVTGSVTHNPGNNGFQLSAAVYAAMNNTPDVSDSSLITSSSNPTSLTLPTLSTTQPVATAILLAAQANFVSASFSPANYTLRMNGNNQLIADAPANGAGSHGGEVLSWSNNASLGVVGTLMAFPAVVVPINWLLEPSCPSLGDTWKVTIA